jgi:hypothetical protein
VVVHVRSGQVMLLVIPRLPAALPLHLDACRRYAFGFGPVQLAGGGMEVWCMLIWLRHGDVDGFH